MTRQWTVKVDGNNVKTLHDGESVEIGRKPLRPLSDDGFARLDIMDPGKSMSKRHAVLSVDKQGNCSVRDLHSTNGSFVVTNNGQLMRLPAGEDIKLPIDSMTLQFGDVRLTLESASELDAMMRGAGVPVTSRAAAQVYVRPVAVITRRQVKEFRTVHSRV